MQHRRVSQQAQLNGEVVQRIGPSVSPDESDLRHLLDFISMAAHDLKSPLMVLAGAAKTLRERDISEEELNECLDRMVRNITSLQFLAADLTDAVATQNGQCRFEFETLDLTTLTRDVVRDFAATCQNHPFALEAEGSCPVCGDAQRLTRMIANLLSNAVKYSASEREISVAIWQSETAVYLTVHDRGVGIADADIERLFLPFERLDATRHMAQGNGLGLLSVQKIAELHGAVIEIQGQTQQGTMVKVSFPLAGE